MIFYEGPSVIDGTPVIGIAVPKSKNPKTGNMIQTFIMSAEIDPVTAAKWGKDRCVCGDCQHRPANDGSCYVNLGQSPLAVWRAWNRGSYETVNINKLTSRKMRMGSYGDPLAIPFDAWAPLIDACTDNTGYTHQWKDHLDSPFRAHVMASVDSDADAQLASQNGWRYFRVRTADSPELENEVICPASEEGGHKVQCISCLACSGASGRKSNIVINVHGSRSKNFIASDAA